MPSRRDVLKAGGLVGTGLLAGAATQYGAWEPAPLSTPQDAWLQPRYGAGNTGHNPNASPPRSSPSLVHSYDVAESVNAVVADVDRLYAGTEHAAYAFDRDSTDGEWDRPASAYRVAVGPDVVVAAGRNTVTAFEAATGRERWRLSTGDSAFGVLVDERTAYVGRRGHLDAYALDTGDRRWRLQTGSRTYPGFDDDRLLVGGTYLDAYEPRSDVEGVVESGPTRAWQCDDVHGPTRPVDAGDYTLAGTSTCLQVTTCGLSAVDADGGHEYHVELGNNAGQVATDGDRAYVVSMLYGDSENGYNAADETTLHALDPSSGDELWSFRRAGWFCAPVVADGAVYVGERGGVNGDGDLYALDAESGDELWTYTFADGVNVLAAVGDFLYAGTDDGTVLQLR